MKTSRARRSGFWLIPLLLLLWSQNAQSHKQPVHQYIAREAYSLLLQTEGRDIPQLSSFIGLADVSAAGDSAWQKGFVTTGAWREDDEDVVYHFDILPGLNYALTSITHFWDADQGDLADNMFTLEIDQSPLPPIEANIGPYPSAFLKMMKFAHGGWVLWYPRTIVCQNTANDHYLIITPLVATAGFGIPVAYDDLTKFYRDRTLTVRSDQTSACVVADVNDLKTINLSDVAEIKVQEDVRDIIAWEIVGRMCHLLGDMSVPAHAHRDEHGLNPDSYEDYVGGQGGPYKAWDHTNCGSPIILNNSSDAVLHSLMYLTQEQADHFGSNGPAQGNGNDNIGGNPTPKEVSFLTSLDLSTFGGPTTDAGPWTTDNLNIIRDRTIPFVIRTTAGLLYWFCHEAGLIDTIATSAPVSADLSAPVAFTLEQNYPNPFNPSTTIQYTLAGIRRQASGVSDVRIAICDVLGREVVRLVDARQEPGTYEVKFDGSHLASGVYFCRMTAGTTMQVKAILLER